jgi:TonB family protein
MNLPPVVRVALLTVALLSGFAAPLTAQNVLITEFKGKYLPVVRARDSRPYVEFEGKQVAADGLRYALHKVDEYLPVFISVRDMEVSTSAVDWDGSEINHEFHLRAKLETPYWLDDVFIVLELDTDSAGKVLFLHEVGELKPRDFKWIALRVPMKSALGSGHYQVHLFSKGVEVLHSNLDAMYCDSVVDHMTETRIAAIKDAQPKFFFGPQPEYPAALLKAKTAGKVLVSIRIGANGRVYDPAVKNASDPAFGAAALAAVRLWRFLPLVKNGRAVEAHVTMPLDFTPPTDAVGKS